MFGWSFLWSEGGGGPPPPDVEQDLFLPASWDGTYWTSSGENQTPAKQFETQMGLITQFPEYLLFDGATGLIARDYGVFPDWDDKDLIYHLDFESPDVASGANQFIFRRRNTNFREPVSVFISATGNLTVNIYDKLGGFKQFLFFLASNTRYKVDIVITELEIDVLVDGTSLGAQTTPGYPEVADEAPTLGSNSAGNFFTGFLYEFSVDY